MRRLLGAMDGVALHPDGGTLYLLRYQVVPPDWPLVTNKDGQARRLRQTFKLMTRSRHRWGIKRVTA